MLACSESPLAGLHISERANSSAPAFLLRLPVRLKVSDLVVQLALGMALSLGLAGEGEVGKIVFGALGVRSEQLRLLGVQEGEGLGTRPVRLHAHRDSFNFRFTERCWR